MACNRLKKECTSDKKLYLSLFIGRLPVNRFLKDLDISDIMLALGEFFCLEDILPVLADCNTPVFIPNFNLNRLLFRLPFEQD